MHAALEAGEVGLARRDTERRYPARFQLVLASPPCGCGVPEPDCSCSKAARRRFLSRLTGPLLDRIDLRVRLQPATPLSATDQPDTVAVRRRRVQQARDRAALRWAEHGEYTNAEVPASALRHRSLPTAALTLVDSGLASGSLTRRGADRALRVAWTLADLAELAHPGPDQVAEALAFRDRRLT